MHNLHHAPTMSRTKQKCHWDPSEPTDENVDPNKPDTGEWSNEEADILAGTPRRLMSLSGTPKHYISFFLLRTSSPYIPTLYSQRYIFYAQSHFNFAASGSYSREQTIGAERFAFNLITCLWQTLTKLAPLKSSLRTPSTMSRRRSRTSKVFVCLCFNKGA